MKSDIHILGASLVYATCSECHMRCAPEAHQHDGLWYCRECCPVCHEATIPKAAELTGSDPDFTGDMTTDEFIREIREKTT